MRIIPLLFCLALVHQEIAHAKFEKSCQDLLNQKDGHGDLVYWRSKRQLRDEKAANDAIRNLYIAAFKNQKVQALAFDSTCEEEIEALQKLNAKSWSKRFVGSSSGQCLSYLETSCKSELRNDYFKSPINAQAPSQVIKAGERVVIPVTVESWTKDLVWKWTQKSGTSISGMTTDPDGRLSFVAPTPKCGNLDKIELSAVATDKSKRSESAIVTVRVDRPYCQIEESIVGKQTRALSVDSYNRLWVGTQKGLIMKGLDGFWSLPASFVEGEVESLAFNPNDEMVWVATMQNGIFVSQGSKINVMSSWQDSRSKQKFLAGARAKAIAFYEKSVYLGRANGIEVRSLDSGDISKKLLEGVSIQAIESDDSGKLWIGASDGLYSYEPKTDKLTRFDSANWTKGVKEEKTQVNSIVVNGNEIYFAIGKTGKFDEQGKAYDVKLGGVVRADLAKNEWRLFAKADGLAADDATKLEVDSLGRVWVASGGDLSWFTPGATALEGTWKTYRMPGKVFIKDIAYDRENHALWVGTLSHGLLRLALDIFPD